MSIRHKTANAKQRPGVWRKNMLQKLTGVFGFAVLSKNEPQLQAQFQ
jgi:hypothetical protein